jgi:hypothetical protein
MSLHHGGSDLIEPYPHEASRDFNLAFKIISEALRGDHCFLNSRRTLLDPNRRKGLGVDRPLFLGALHSCYPVGSENYAAFFAVQQDRCAALCA